MLVEAVDQSLSDQGYGRIKDHLAVCTDERRGQHYGRIVTALKQLAGMNHHDFGRTSVFTRPEALALVRHCEASLLMVGELKPPPPGFGFMIQPTFQGDQENGRMGGSFLKAHSSDRSGKRVP